MSGHDINIVKTQSFPAVVNFWPYAIIGWFVIFASALAAWATFAIRQKLDLVSPDYYEQEIRYQDQVDRLNRTSGVRGEVVVQYDGAKGEVTLRLPAVGPVDAVSGQVQFYRPADARLDFVVPLAVDSVGGQRIDVKGVRGGHWKVRPQWTIKNREYFIEQTVVLNETGSVGLPLVLKGK